jgi:hypothetical protein
VSHLTATLSSQQQPKLIITERYFPCPNEKFKFEIFHLGLVFRNLQINYVLVSFAPFLFSLAVSFPRRRQNSA